LTIGERPLFFSILAILWLLILGYGAAFMFYTNHPGGGFGFALIAAGTVYFEFLTEFRRVPVHIMYWALQVTFVCLILGYVSGRILIHKEQTNQSDHVFVTMSGKGAPEEGKNGPELEGRLIFSGNSALLIYSKDHGVMLVRWDNIKEISSKSSTNLVQPFVLVPYSP
jgi:hypothetical protein